MKLENIDPEIFDFLEKGLGIVSTSHFAYDFFKKIVSHVMLYYLTNFNCLTAFTSWDNIYNVTVNQVVTL